MDQKPDCFACVSLKPLGVAMDRYASLETFAGLAGITRQAAWNAARQGSWRGHILDVRTISSVGGSSGKAYEVAVSSLPQHLRLRYLELHGPLETDRQTSDKSSLEREFRYRIIQPVLALEKNSSERGKLINNICSRKHARPDGKKINISIPNFYRWLSLYEKGGLSALSNKGRTDKGKPRVLITRRWDKIAEELPLTDKMRVSSKLKRYVRGLHAEHVSAGNIINKAALELFLLSQAAGLHLTRADCAIPEHYVDNERKYRKVGIKAKDAKKFYDDSAHIFRKPVPVPMELVYGDVHHLDFVLSPMDGYNQYPKAISWLDMATNRIWMDVVVLREGEGIRNEHVIESFMRMCAEWGVPQCLYLDNGSEYNWADFITDAMNLAKLEPARFRSDIRYCERDRSLIRATPHNARAKPIEGVFWLLENNDFRPLPGWIGGNRQNKKTSKVGKQPNPYPGTPDEFRAAISNALRQYHARAQSRLLGKLKESPDETYQKAIEAGWTRTIIDPAAFAVAFSVEKRLKVRNGYVQYDRDRWVCRELRAYQDPYVIALIPKYAAWNRLPLKDADGRLMGFAERATLWDARDPGGAVESHQWQKEQRQAVRELQADIEKVDIEKDNARFVASLPPTPVAPIGATITASPEAREIMAGINEESEARFSREVLDDLRKQREAREIENSPFAQNLKKRSKKWAS